MWVRSQDKYDLVKANSFALIYDKSIATYVNGINTPIILGTYKSEERAMQVLDYIHAVISKDARQDYIKHAVRHTSETVFVMPVE